MTSNLIKWSILRQHSSRSCSTLWNTSYQTRSRRFRDTRRSRL